LGREVNNLHWPSAEVNIKYSSVPSLPPHSFMALCYNKQR